MVPFPRAEAQCRLLSRLSIEPNAQGVLAAAGVFFDHLAGSVGHQVLVRWAPQHGCRDAAGGIGTERTHFDDREVAIEAIAAAGGGR